MINLKAWFGLAALAIGVALGASGQARADQVLTFDDLPTPDPGGTSIPDGYGGFHWDNFYYMNGTTNNYNPSGYQNAIVSGTNVAYNGFGTPGTVSVDSPNLFTFNSVSLTGAWNDGLSIEIDGYKAGSLLYSRTVTVDTSGPALFNFDFVGIDSLTFTSSGGTHHDGYALEGENFAMDNFTTGGAVPEPSSLISAAAAVAAGLGYRARRRRRAA